MSDNRSILGRGLPLTDALFDALETGKRAKRKSLGDWELPSRACRERQDRMRATEKFLVPTLDTKKEGTIMELSVPSWVRPPVTTGADDALGVAARLPGCSDIPPPGMYLPRTLAYQGASASLFLETRR